MSLLDEIEQLEIEAVEAMGMLNDFSALLPA
jgi:hypothetical protein